MDAVAVPVAANGIGEVERKAQRSYWEEHSKDLTVEAMMLDSRAADLDKEERPEVLSVLPSYKGKSVLELGAGIGRFTGELAKEAGHVLALDFIESVIKKNENINGHNKNITFMCADVTSPDLKIEDNSIDLIFSNWLLMYLSDEEVEKLVGRMVKWLKGVMLSPIWRFQKESESNTLPGAKIFKECHSYDKDGGSYELSLETCKCIGAYVKSKKNQNQVKSTEDRGFQRFLDNVQYKTTGILRYERVFGEGYVSTGGIETTKEFVDKLDLKPGQKVLDVGCGIGGGDFYMAENYDAHVLGIDLSINMVSFAIERAIGRKCSVEFEVADCTTKTYPPNTFDVTYSRDTILHIHMLEDAGFHHVIAEDRTDQFLRVLQRELAEVEKNKEAFLADFTQEDYDDIVNGWNAKLKRSSAGEQRDAEYKGRRDTRRTNPVHTTNERAGDSERRAGGMRGGEMLTASRGAAASSSTAAAAATVDLAGRAGAAGGGGGGGNFPLAVALIAFAFANFLNLLAIWLKEKRWDARKFLTSAGIISSLSATVGSLAVAVGQQEGGDSSSFALALVFAAVVMYDASGIRFHTGRQAALLNQIVSDFPPEHPIISSFRPLQEPLGHSPFQVFAGALVGCSIAYLMGKSV
uniref:phosphoethanolamine N-methyltransferase n=1 Tax=Oryza meridionalis TaxID=40149 RepID=A0A0E0DUF5_9ORYZ